MRNRGFISIIVIAIVAIVLLKIWFGFDFFKWLNTPEIKGFFLKIWDVVVVIWDKYLKEIFHSLTQFVSDLINRRM
jgi:hypothetical protein